MKYVVLQPTSGVASNPSALGSVDNYVAVTIHALDQYGNIANENRAVSISLTNSAMPSDASSLVTMSGGSGTKNIIDHVAEAVTISLVDSQHTLLNVQSTASVVFVPGKSYSSMFSSYLILRI